MAGWEKFARGKRIYSPRDIVDEAFTQLGAAPWTHCSAIVNFVAGGGEGCVFHIPVFLLEDRDNVELCRRLILSKQQLEFIATRMPFLRVTVLTEFVR